VNNNASCDSYNRSFKQTLATIEAQHLTYNLFERNSNSVAFTLLLNAGIHPPEEVRGDNLYGKAPSYGVQLVLP
jgi:hypothetical protein